MDNREFLGKEPIGKLLFKVAIPTVLAQLVNMLYNIVDRIFIGHMEDIGDIIAVTFTAVLFAFQFRAALSAMDKDKDQK